MRGGVAPLGVAVALAVASTAAARADTPAVAINQLDYSRHPELRAYVSVTHADRRPVAGLKAEGFRILVDGAPVGAPAVSTVRTSREPITVVLALDRSGSMRGEPIRQARAAAEALIGQLDARDTVGFVAFDDRVSVVASPTREHKSVVAQVQAMALGRDTAINDAVMEAVREAAATRARVKAVVLLTDGRENKSTTTVAHVVDAARRERVFVHTVGLGPQIDRRALRALADGTGGVALESPRPAGLVRLFEEIGALLKNEYELTFRAPGELDDRLHEVVVAATVGDAIAEARLPYRLVARTSGGPRKDAARSEERLYLGIAAGIVLAGALGSSITVLVWRRRAAATPRRRA
ncbi:MAG TPA: vWA domain-containing protein [Terriglobales bacterium]|nr:vWA domain-containing protein [Terriglobales bacterium]